MKEKNEKELKPPTEKSETEIKSPEIDQEALKYFLEHQEEIKSALDNKTDVVVSVVEKVEIVINGESFKNSTICIGDTCYKVVDGKVKVHPNHKKQVEAHVKVGG